MADGDPIRIGRDNVASNPGAQTLLRRAANSTSTDPVFTVRTPVGGDGIHGEASGDRTGVQGSSASGTGVNGESTSGLGVRGESTESDGVRGISGRSGNGVVGTSGALRQPVINIGDGVRGESETSAGVRGVSEVGDGVIGEARREGAGVSGHSSTGNGVFGRSTSAAAVSGLSDSGSGVDGVSISGGAGVSGFSSVGTGVHGQSFEGFGMVASSETNIGVQATSSSRTAVLGTGDDIGVHGQSFEGFGVFGSSKVRPDGTGGSAIGVLGITPGLAGQHVNTPAVRGRNEGSGRGVQGDSVNGVGVEGICRNPSNNISNRRVGGFFNGGVIIVNGLKPFTIDHPLDPENKYLVHTSVESSEMKNVYDGVAHLDGDGAAWVELPEWFEALNGDFRYQLTAVGGAAPNLHVAEEVSENRFKIAGGQAGMKVCWQVTGSRKDPWAAANPFEVEQEKPEEDRGRYLDPSLYDAPEEQRALVGPTADEEERLRRIDETTRLAEEQRQEMEEQLRRRRERQEEAPPEST